MHIAIAFVIAICLFASFHPIVEAPQGEINLDVGVNSPVVINPSVKPLSELTFKNVMKQNYDYSCGSAALATILNYYLNENFTENQVIHGLMEYGNAKSIMERRAFSLLDMKSFVNKLGYRGVGYKAEIKDLVELRKPCIVPIQFLGYRHFTVFRGIHGNHVFLADPFRGNTSYTVADFTKMWFENVAFVVYPEGAPELSALRLTNIDLRYIREDSIQDLLTIYGPEFTLPNKFDRYFYHPLPDEYKKYSPN